VNAPVPVPGTLTVSRAVANGTVELALDGELDLAGARGLEESLAAAEREGPARLVVDLARLAFIDSSGLRVLLQANARAKEHGRELLLRPGTPAVQRVFEVTGALAILRFEDAPVD